MSTLKRLSGVTLVDLLVVARELDDDEIEQIRVMGGNANPEALALQIRNTASMVWTWVDSDTQEALAIGGFIQTGATVYRSFFLSNPRVWTEFGSEITKSVAEVLTHVKEKLETVRLETWCLPERTIAREWYEKIGLKFDAELDGVGINGEPVVIYSTVAKKSAIEVIPAGSIRIQ